MKVSELAEALREYALIDECEGGNPVVIQAEREAAALIEAQAKELEEMHRRNDELNREISGVRRSYWDERAKARKLMEALASHSKEGEQG